MKMPNMRLISLEEVHSFVMQEYSIDSKMWKSQI